MKVLCTIHDMKLEALPGKLSQIKVERPGIFFFFKPDKISLMISSWGKKGGLLIFSQKEDAVKSLLSEST